MATPFVQFPLLFPSRLEDDCAAAPRWSEWYANGRSYLKVVGPHPDRYDLFEQDLRSLDETVRILKVDDMSTWLRYCNADRWFPMQQPNVRHVHPGMYSFSCMP